jgi:uncharacterized repeat protein (TIGR01451 family)
MSNTVGNNVMFTLFNKNKKIAAFVAVLALLLSSVIGLSFIKPIFSIAANSPQCSTTPGKWNTGGETNNLTGNYTMRSGTVVDIVNTGTAFVQNRPSYSANTGVYFSRGGQGGVASNTKSVITLTPEVDNRQFGIRFLNANESQKIEFFDGANKVFLPLPNTTGSNPIVAGEIVSQGPVNGGIVAEANFTWNLTNNISKIIVTALGSEDDVSFFINSDCNEPPVTQNDFYSVNTGGNVYISPLNGDKDPLDEAIKLFAVNGVEIINGIEQTIPVTNGTVTKEPQGALRFSPAAVGSSSFPYTIIDAGGAKADGTVSVTIYASTVNGLEPLYCDRMYGVFNGGSGDVFTKLQRVNRDGTIDPVITTLTASTTASALDKVSGKFFYITSANTAFPNTLFFYDPSTGQHVNTNKVFPVTPINYNIPVATGGAVNKLNSIITMGITQEGKGYAMDGPGKLYKFSTIPPYNIDTNSTAVQDVLNNEVQFASTEKGDMVMTNNGNILITGWRLETTTPTTYTPYFYRINDPDNLPLATLRGKIGNTTFDSIFNAMAFGRDNELYLTQKDGRMFKLSVKDLSVTNIPTDNNGAASLSSCIFPPFIRKITSEKTFKNLTDGSAGFAKAGDLIEYKIVARNSGDIIIGDVVMSDVLPEGTEYIANSTTLNGVAVADSTGLMPFIEGKQVNSVGQVKGSLIVDTTPSVEDHEAIVKFKVKVKNPIPSGVTILSNQASFLGDSATTGTSDDPTRPGTEDATLTQLDLKTDLSITKTVNKDRPNRGDTIAFTITVNNSGDNDAIDVVVDDQLPVGYEFISANAELGGYDPVLGKWYIGNLGGKSSKKLDILVTVNQVLIDKTVSPVTSKSVTNTATVSTSTFDSNNTNNTASVIIKPLTADLVMTSSVDIPRPDVNDDVTFVIKIKNTGPDASTAIVAEITPPSTTTILSSNTSQGSITANGASFLWSVGDIAVGQEVTLTYLANVDSAGKAGIQGKIIENEVFDSIPENNKTTTEIDPYFAELKLTKAVSNEKPNVGDKITFFVKIDNNGPDTSRFITIKETMPAGVEFIEAKTPPGTASTYTVTGPNGSGEWKIDSLVSATDDQLNSSKILQMIGIVKSSLKQTNNAEITGVKTFDPNKLNNKASAFETPKISDLQITKTTNTEFPKLNSNVLFTIKVKNLGVDVATGIEVTDLLPVGLDYISYNSSVGTYDKLSGIWSGITLLPVGSEATLTVVAKANKVGTMKNTAKITKVDTFDSNPNNNEAFVTVIALSSDLALTKTVSNDKPNVGDIVDYNIAIKNNGPSESRNITVEDKLPEGLELVSFSSPDTAAFYDVANGKWNNVGNIQVGEIKNLRYKIKVTGVIKSITNIATVSSETADTNPNNNTDDVTIYPVYADLNVLKTVDNPKPFINSEVVFKIVIGNKGTYDAPNTIVTDLLPAGAEFVSSTIPTEYNHLTGEWKLPLPLKVNEVRELLIRAKITNPDKLTNKVTIKSNLVDPNPSDNTSTVDVDAVDNEIIVRKLVSNNKPAFNSNVTYILEVENLGLDTVPVVNVKDVLPAGTQFVSSSSTEYDSTTGIWSLKNVLGKSKVALNIIAKVIGTDGKITNCADAGIVLGDTLVNNNKACADIEPEITNISVTKVAKASSVNIGTNGTFVITIKNDGKQTARNVVVTDPVPANATYVSSTNPGYNPTTGILSLGDVVAGATINFELTYTVNKTGSINNEVKVKTDTPELNLNDNTATATIDPFGADLEVIKTASNTNPNLYSNVNYTITVKNNGPSDAEDVTVNDALPAGIDYISSLTGTGTYDNATHTWNVGKIPNGQVVTLTITSKINALNKTDNTAEVKSKTFDYNTSNNKSTATIDPNYADLEVVKTVDNANPTFGSIVNYTIAFKNKGPKDATDVVVTDELPIGMTALTSTSTIGIVTAGNDLLTIPLLKAGESGTWTIKVQLNLNTDIKTNIAKINSKNTPDNNLGNNESKATVDPLATDLAITKIASNKNPKVGEEFTFDIVATNKGPDSAKDVVIVDNFSSDFKIVNVNFNTTGVTTSVGASSFNVKKPTLAVNETIIIKVKAIAINFVNSIDNIVTIDSSTPDTDRSNNTAKETVFPKYTELKLSKTVNNTTPQQYGEVEYTIKIEVLGQTAENLKIIDALPNDVEYISSNTNSGTYETASGTWNLGNANVGEYTLTIKAKALGTIKTTNTVTPTTDTPQKTPETPKTSSIDPNGAPDAKDDKGNTKPTSPVTLQLINGNNTTNDQSVTDTDPDSDPLVITAIDGKSITPGQTITLTDGSKVTLNTDGKSVTVTPSSPYAKDDIKFSYTISDGKGGTDTANVVVMLTPLEADIQATKTVSNPKPQVGEEVTFTLTAFNDGPDIALNVIGDDKLPANFSYISSSSTAYNASTGIWTIGDMPSKATASITIRAKATSSEPSENILKLTTQSSDKTPGNNESKVPLDPNGAPIAIDDIGNTKPTLPIVMKIVDGNGTIGPVQKDNSVTDTDPDGDVLIITKINGVLAVAGGSYTLPTSDIVTIDLTGKVVTVTPKNLLSTTPIKFTYTISDNKGGESTANVTVLLQELSADLKVLKTVDNSAPTPGQFINFKLTTTNLGPDTAYATVLTDALPQGLEFVDVEPSTATYDTNSKTINLGDLAANQVNVITIMAKVITNVPVTNVVTIKSATPDPDLTNNISKVDVDPLSADLSLTKKVSKSNVRLGEEVEYVIEVKNEGPDEATDVVVTESLPTGLTFLSSDTTNYNLTTGLWNIGTIAPNTTKTLKLKAKSTILGNILNTVTVKSTTYDPTPQPPVDAKIVVNGDPVAKPDYGTTDPGTQLSMALVFGGNGVYSTSGLSDQSVLDQDPENDTITIDKIAGIKAVANVSITLADGTKVTPDATLTKVMVTPKDAASVYQINFEYTVTDNNGGYSTATVKVDILDAKDDNYTIEFNKPLKLDLFANDNSSKDQTSIKLTSINGINVLPNTTIVINGGKLLIGTDMSVTFVPNSDFSGPTDFTYSIVDSSGNIATAKVTLSVNNGNPIANNDYGTTDPGTPLTMNIVGGGNGTFSPAGLSDQSKQDTDPNKEPLTIKSIAGIAVVAGQTVTLGDNSKVTVDSTLTKVDITSKDNTSVYQINFDYIITDGKGGEATAKVTVDILDANDDQYSIPSNGKINLDILTNDKSSKDQSTIKITKINGVTTTPNSTIKITGGTLTIDNEGKLSFQADQGFSGIVIFEYNIVDGSGNNDTAKVTINVANGAPVAKDDKGVTKPTEAIVMKLVEGGNGIVSPNKQVDNSVADNDPENDPLTISAINGLPMTSGQTITLPDGSKVTLNPDLKTVTILAKDYKSTANITFNYTITDTNNQTATANVIVELIEPLADIKLNKTVNNSTPQIGETIEYTISVNNIGPDTAKEVVVLESLPAGLTFISSNDINYNLTTGTWNIGDIEKDTTKTLVLKAKATISSKIINQVTVTTSTKDPTPNPPVEVPIDPNANPLATDDYGTTDPQAPLTMQLVNGGTKVFSATGLSDQSILDSDIDGDNITITKIDNKDIAPNGTVTLSDGTIIKLSVDAKSVIVTSKDNTSVYTIKFPYTISDGKGGFATANVLVEMLDANDDIASTVTNSSVIVKVLVNDKNSNGSLMTITHINGQLVSFGDKVKVDNGTAVANNDGTITFTPDKDYTGPAKFTYSINDGSKNVDTATVTITMTNDVPTANDDSGITYNDMPITMKIVKGGSPEANSQGQFDNSVLDSDKDGDNLTISKIDGLAVVADQEVTLVSGNKVKLLPDLQTIIGTAYNTTTTKDFEFTYEITDGKGGFATAKVKIKILCKAFPDFDTTSKNMPKNVMPMANDIAYEPTIKMLGGNKVVIPDKDGYLPKPDPIPDPDPKPDTKEESCKGKSGVEYLLCIFNWVPKKIVFFDIQSRAQAVVSTPTNISVVKDATVKTNFDGSITVIPNTGFVGVITFTYDIADSDGDVTQSTVTITIPDPVADIDLTKAVNNSKPQVGEIVDYTLEVTNRGPDTSVGVEVQDLLPAGLQYVSDNGAGKYISTTGIWTIGDMIKDAKATLIIKAKALVSTVIINKATVTTKTQDPTPNPPREVPIDPNGAPIAKDDTGITKPTDKIVMNIVEGGNGIVGANKQIDNSVLDIDPDNEPGTNPTDTLTITQIDGKPVAASQQIVLADGSKVTLNSNLKSVTVEAKEPTSIDPIKFPYTITDGHGGTDTANVTVTLLPLEADLEANKKVSNATPKLGEVVTFTLTATNLGPDLALAVEGKDLLPTNFNNYTSTASNFNTTTGIWSIGDLASGAKATITIQATASKAEKSENVLTLTTKSEDKVPGNNISKVPLEPNISKSADVSIIKTAMPRGELKLGDIIDYTLTVTNNGPDTAEAVIANDLLPAELEYVSHMTATGTYLKSTGVWSIGDLKAKAIATLTIKAKTLKAGDITNFAEVISKTPDPTPDNNKTKVTVPVLPPVTVRTGAKQIYLISYVAGILALLTALVLLNRTKVIKR